MQMFLDHGIIVGLNKPGSSLYKCIPVFVTPDEHASYEALTNRTVREIKDMIHQCLLSIEDQGLKEAFCTLFDNLLKKRVAKEEYIEFHNELHECLEDQASGSISISRMRSRMRI